MVIQIVVKQLLKNVNEYGIFLTTSIWVNGLFF